MNHKKYTQSDLATAIQSSLNGTTLEFSFQEDEKTVSVLVDLVDIISTHSQDHGIIAIGAKDGKALVLETTAVSVDLRGSAFADPIGVARRDTPLGVYRLFTGKADFPLCYLMTPFKGCGIDDVTIYWFVNDGVTEITVDGQPLQAQSAEIMPNLIASWLPVTLQGPSSIEAGQSAQFVVHAPENTVVYLETTAGTLDRTRAVDGETVVLSTIAQTGATTGKIKAGYKYWPAKVQHSFSITPAQGA